MSRYEYMTIPRWPNPPLSSVTDTAVPYVPRTDAEFLRLATELGANGWRICAKDDGGAWFVRELQ